MENEFQIVRSSVLRKYKTKEWFTNASHYLLSRISSIEERIISSFRYVELHTENRAVFSYEYASLLRDLGSTFSSISDIFVRGTIAELCDVKETNFSHYRKFLFNHVSPCHYTVCIRPLHPLGIVYPFWDMQTENDTPKWWSSYNKIKHMDHTEYRVGNLENCITALSALVLIAHWMGIFVSDLLFVNVGILLRRDSVESYNEKCLFPVLL